MQLLVLSYDTLNGKPITAACEAWYTDSWLIDLLESDSRRKDVPAQERLLQMLKDSDPTMRYTACEDLRAANESNEQVVDALEQATQDKDTRVAYAAQRALEAGVHQLVLIKLGRAIPAIVPDKPRQTSKQLSPKVAKPRKKTTPGATLIWIGLGLLIVGFLCAFRTHEPAAVLSMILGGALLLVGVVMLFNTLLGL